MRISLTLISLLIIKYSYAQCPADEAALIAGGTFSGTCTINIGAATNITNSVIISSGTLTLNGGAGNVTVSGAGSIEIQSGATLVIEDGSLTVSGGASFTSAGTMTVDDGILITGNTSSADFQTGSSTTLDGNFEVLDSDVTIAGTITDTQADQDEILLRGTSTVTVNTGADISGFDDIEFRNNDGVSRLIINGGSVSIIDDLDLRPTSTDGDFVEVNGGTLDVGGNIALPDNATNNLLIINSGGNVTASTINGATPGDPADLPDGVVLNGGSDIEVGGVVLPVELLSFSSSYDEKTKVVELQWSTAVELNNQGFYVERSAFGVSAFEQIAFIKGHGNSQEVQNYTFQDRNIFSNCYYRLRQIDFDGVFEYSPTIFAQAGSEEPFELRLSPNPSSGSNISIENIPYISFSATLHSLGGVELLNTSKTTVKSVEELLNNSLENAEAGIYLFSYGNQSNKKTIRIIRE